VAYSHQQNIASLGLDIKPTIDWDCEGYAFDQFTRDAQVKQLTTHLKIDLFTTRTTRCRLLSGCCIEIQLTLVFFFLCNHCDLSTDFYTNIRLTNDTIFEPLTTCVVLLTQKVT